jgi:2-methylaconitate isomerase
VSGPLELPAVWMRGGTSKGIFFHERDLPPAGPERDRLLLNVMGSPDPMQIDGLGGTYSSTSKVMIVARSAEPGVDISYRFAQVGVDVPIVDWSGNCGNLTTAIGPFAIDEGLHPAAGPLTRIRLRNENTGVQVEADVPVAGGRARVDGDCRVPGVPHPGAPIVTRYLEPGGGVLGATLPTGQPQDLIAAGGGPIPVSILDVTHPCAFVRATDLGLSFAGMGFPGVGFSGVGFSGIIPAAMNADGGALARLEDIRAQCSVLLKVVAAPQDAAATAPAVPRLVIVDAGQGPERQGPDGQERADLQAVGLSMGKVHHALPMTAALCLAAAAAVPGTIPWELAGSPSASREPAGTELRIRHPKGVVALTAEVGGCGPDVDVRSVGVVRTARRLMAGVVYVRPSDPA